MEKYSAITDEVSLRKNDIINVAITIQAFTTIHFYKSSGFYEQRYSNTKNIEPQCFPIFFSI